MQLKNHWVLAWLPLMALWSVYVIPFMTAWFSSDLVFFTNAWDEESYLTLQGLLGRMLTPGNIPLIPLFYFMKWGGFTGAEINLISDFVIGAGVTSFLYLIFLQQNSKSTFLILCGVCITIFSCLFLNNANPILKSFGIPFKYNLLISGWESYPSILRSPNPQWSYLLISLAGLFYLHKKNLWVLFAVIPFLYFFSALPYIFVILALSPFLLHQISWSLKNTLLVSFLVYLVMGLGLIVLDWIYIRQSVLVVHSGSFERGRDFFIPVALAFHFISLGIRWVSVKAKGLHPARDPLFCILSVFLFASFFVSNFQALSGWYFFPKNIQDYGTNPMAGLALALAVVSVERSGRLFKTAMLSFLALNLVLALNASNFDWRNLRFRVYIGRQISQPEDKDFYLNHPLNALISHRDVAGRIAYATGSFHPPFSYPYHFPFIHNQCEKIPQSMRQGLDYIRSEASQHLDFFEKKNQYIDDALIQRRDSAIKANILCDDMNLGPNFRVIDQFEPSTWTFFP
jgi:hypothetical protein